MIQYLPNAGPTGSKTTVDRSVDPWCRQTRKNTKIMTWCNGSWRLSCKSRLQLQLQLRLQCGLGWGGGDATANPLGSVRAHLSLDEALVHARHRLAGFWLVGGRLRCSMHPAPPDRLENTQRCPRHACTGTLRVPLAKQPTNKNHKQNPQPEPPTLPLPHVQENKNHSKHQRPMHRKKCWDEALSSRFFCLACLTNDTSP